MITNFKSTDFQSGTSLIYILFTFFLLVAVLYPFKAQFISFFEDEKPIRTHQQELKIDNITTWHKSHLPKFKLNLIYPAGWTVDQEGNISQEPRVNIINIYSHQGVLYAGYYNYDLFEKLYNLKSEDQFKREFFNSRGEKFTHIESGKIASSQKFVIFYSNSAQDETSRQKTIQAYIKDKQQDSLLIFTLLSYNETGKNVFAHIIQTASLD